MNDTWVNVGNGHYITIEDMNRVGLSNQQIQTVLDTLPTIERRRLLHGWGILHLCPNQELP